MEFKLARAVLKKETFLILSTIPFLGELFKLKLLYDLPYGQFREKSAEKYVRLDSFLDLLHMLSWMAKMYPYSGKE